MDADHPSNGGPFSTPNHSREEAAIENVFLFPAHDLQGGYNMPEAEVLAFDRVIRPRTEG